MSYDESDHDRELQEQAMEEMFEEWLPEALWERSAEVAAKYLQTYGDAIQGRVDRALSDARRHFGDGMNESAVLRSFTAIELAVGRLLFRPLLLGVFLSEELAARLVRELFEGSSRRERVLLPAVLSHWEVELDALRLANGAKLWDYITGNLRHVRNAIAHDGAITSPDEARATIESVELLLQSVVRPVSDRLGFTLETTGKWSEIRRHTYTRTFDTKDPFGPEG